MQYHILNGDALTDRFVATGIQGETVITRECLVDGNLEGDSLEEFFKTRATYLSSSEENYDSYYTHVVNEFQKIIAAPEGSEFNLWFGYDLFCRANMWFILSLLHDMKDRKDVFVVHPSYLPAKDRWKDFGGATPDNLKTCFEKRIHLSNSDIELGKNLWIAFKNNDLIALKKLAATERLSYPYLDEVCDAHIDRFPHDGEKSRPERIIENIIHETAAEFSTVFPEFFKREGIYGFGDTQVKAIYDKVIKQRS